MKKPTPLCEVMDTGSKRSVVTTLDRGVAGVDKSDTITILIIIKKAVYVLPTLWHTPLDFCFIRPVIRSPSECFMFKEDLLIFIAGMVTAYIFMYFSFLFLRAVQKSGARQDAPQPTCDPQPAPALASQAAEDDDALVALALALAARR